MGGQVVKVNRARCDICNTVLTSQSVDDHQICQCKNLMISGGTERLIRSALYDSKITEVSEFEYDPNVVMAASKFEYDPYIEDD
jgi:hypothetical protein